jgi:hypothetical protein
MKFNNIISCRSRVVVFLWRNLTKIITDYSIFEHAQKEFVNQAISYIVLSDTPLN